MASDIHIHGILLAAGESKRFEGIKQLACVKISEAFNDSMKNEDIMLVNACKQVVSSDFSSQALMLGANADIILPYVPRNVSYYIVENWAEGMGATISSAIKALASNVSHVCIMLTDQVKLEHTHYNELIECAKLYPDKIIAARYNGHLGAPCIFPASFFTELKTLSGDIGARNILRKHRSGVLAVEMPEASIDIDTPEDLHQH